jgi:hypothetical protein
VSEATGCEQRPHRVFEVALAEVLNLRASLEAGLDPAPVLDFLAARPGETFYPSAIARGAGLERKKVVAILDNLALSGEVDMLIKEYGSTYRMGAVTK